MNGSPSFSFQRASAAGVSFETPTISALFFVNAATSSRKSLASCVQPLVPALGKKKRTRRRPLKSESFTFSPASFESANAGAFFPGSSGMVAPCGGRGLLARVR